MKQPKSHPNCCEIVPVQTVHSAVLSELYDSVGWSAYTRDLDQLTNAINGSDFVVIAKEGDSVLGLARAISDNASIVYIQDILVRPSHQGQGIGKSLVRAILTRYEHVRQTVLLTDDRLPCSPEGLPLYGGCTAHDHVVFALLLKGYAKLYGGYAALRAGRVTEALVDLTGGVGKAERERLQLLPSAKYGCLQHGTTAEPTPLAARAG